MIASGSLIQANSWMQWLHKLRQSFSAQCFIEHIWETRKRRGGYWKREAGRHGRYSSHFLLAAHLTSSYTPSHYWDTNSDRERSVTKGTKGLLAYVILMFPPDIQRLLQEELEHVDFPGRRICILLHLFLLLLLSTAA